MYCAVSVANAFLARAGVEGLTLTNRKVQNLVFFAHGVSLGAYDEPLIDHVVKAWPFGPVIPPLYNELRKFGNGPVTEGLKADPNETARLRDDPRASRAIDAVWKTFRVIDGGKLSGISRMRNSPWDVVWNQRHAEFEVIPEDLIREYYASRVRRKEHVPA